MRKKRRQIYRQIMLDKKEASREDQEEDDEEEEKKISSNRGEVEDNAPKKISMDQVQAIQNRVWEVYFLPTGLTLEDLRKSGKSIPSLIFKIQGCDLYAYKDQTMTKVVFIHGLQGCDFFLQQSES